VVEGYEVLVDEVVRLELRLHVVLTGGRGRGKRGGLEWGWMGAGQGSG
jgi:hypothetical protein